VRRVKLGRDNASWSYCPSRRLTLLLLPLLLVLWTTHSKASHGREEINSISPDRVKALIDGGEKLLFVDIRPPRDYQEKRVTGGSFDSCCRAGKKLGEIPKTGRIIIYCTCKPGSEDADAYFLLRDNGYRNVAVMEEGFPGWMKRKLPVEGAAVKH
jgi:rhodanese-related sulfurtransferase